MLLSPTFEMSKFLVTQVNMSDNLKLLQKVTTYEQPLYKKKKKNQTTQRSSFTYNASFHHQVNLVNVHS